MIKGYFIISLTFCFFKKFWQINIKFSELYTDKKILNLKRLRSEGVKFFKNKITHRRG